MVGIAHLPERSARSQSTTCHKSHSQFKRTARQTLAKRFLAVLSARVAMPRKPLRRQTACSMTMRARPHDGTAPKPMLTIWLRSGILLPGEPWHHHRGRQVTRLGPRPNSSEVPVRYEKADTILRIALDMQGTAEGLSLDDIQRNYADRPLSRRTAERLRDAIERVFPQMQQANPGELPKRWRLPIGTVSGFAAVSAEELADLTAGVSLLRRENMLVQAQNAERAVSKLRALLRSDALARVAPDLEALTEAEGIALRPGPRPKINSGIVVSLRQAIIANRKIRLPLQIPRIWEDWLRYGPPIRLRLWQPPLSPRME